MTNLPAYSDTLVNLARTADRATLAVAAASWHLSSLRDDYDPPHYKLGDDSLSDWTGNRVELLEKQLPWLVAAVNSLIVTESKPWFEVQPDRFGGIQMPDSVLMLFEPHMQAAFTFQGMSEGLAKAVLVAHEHHVILFDGEGYLVPKMYPKNFVEVWWRRYWTCAHTGHVYEMALIENPLYGWDCYGCER